MDFDLSAYILLQENKNIMEIMLAILFCFLVAKAFNLFGF